MTTAILVSNHECKTSLTTMHNLRQKWYNSMICFGQCLCCQKACMFEFSNRSFQKRSIYTPNMEEIESITQPSLSLFVSLDDPQRFKTFLASNSSTCWMAEIAFVDLWSMDLFWNNPISCKLASHEISCSKSELYLDVHKKIIDTVFVEVLYIKNIAFFKQGKM